jgi:hypothetical protein
MNNPVDAVDRTGKDAMFILFPDHSIGTGIGDLKTNAVGHAGVLLIDEDGTTKYYTFGRYDDGKLGKAMNIPVPNVVMDEDGVATKESIQKVLKSLSKKDGQSKKVEARYFDVENFDDMNDFAKSKVKEYKENISSNGGKKQIYSILNYNCGDFAIEVIGEGTWYLPHHLTFSPRPIGAFKDLGVFTGWSFYSYDPNDN